MADASVAAQIARLARTVHGFAPRRTIAALLFMILGTLTEGVSLVLLVPLLTLIGTTHGPRRTVTLNIGTPGGWLPEHLALGLPIVLAAFVALIALRALLMRLKDIFTTQLLYDFTNGVRRDMFASIARARWEMIARMRVSDLDHALTADMDRMQAATMQLLLLIQSLVLLGIYLAVSLALSPTMTAFAGAIGAASLLLLQPVRRRAAAYGRTLTTQRQDQYRIVAQFLGGIKTAKSFGAEPAYIAQLGTSLEGMRDATLRFLRVQTAGAAAFQIVSAVTLAAFVWLALDVLALSQARIVVMILLMMRLAPRFIALQSTLQEVLVNLAAFQTMQRLRDTCDAAREPVPTAAPSPMAFRHAIRFESVGFRYAADAARTILKDARFAIRAGAVTALVGPSGSGKSTIADMLLGLLEPETGAILIDDAPLADIDRASWRARVAYVPQDVFLMHDSIAANLLLAAPGADAAALWDALGRANAAGFVRRLPHGLDTIVGERGVRLSGGERQRIALARALLRAPLLLILDEATSALDWESRTLIAQSIAALRGGIAIVIIAHDRSVAEDADWIVEIEDGRVVERATRVAAVAESGSYTSRMRRFE